MYHVDHNNDCFVTEYEDLYHVPESDPSGIVSYALWLEKRLRESKISEQMAINPRRDGYLRRISWLHFLCNAMEISTKELVKQFRHKSQHPFRSLDEEKHFVEDAQHFFQSWEEWTTKGPAMGVGSTSGFADWPLEEARD